MIHFDLNYKKMNLMFFLSFFDWIFLGSGNLIQNLFFFFGSNICRVKQKTLQISVVGVFFSLLSLFSFWIIFRVCEWLTYNKQTTTNNRKTKKATNYDFVYSFLYKSKWEMERDGYFVLFIFIAQKLQL